MITIEPITALNMFLFKAVRLRALQDAPRSFGSTYAKESQLSDADWTKRVERWNGENGAGFLAVDKDTARGIAGSLLDQNDRTRAHLISMLGFSRTGRTEPDPNDPAVIEYEMSRAIP